MAPQFDRAAWSIMVRDARRAALLTMRTSSWAAVASPFSMTGLTTQQFRLFQQSWIASLRSQ
jgi:hypothetical protein